MLTRRRVSRIFYLRKFFDYPLSLKPETFINMGLKRTFNAGIGYLKSSLIKLDETSLENFYINRFGRPLYEMFFEDDRRTRLEFLNLVRWCKADVIFTHNAHDYNPDHMLTTKIINDIAAEGMIGILRPLGLSK